MTLLTSFKRALLFFTLLLLGFQSFGQTRIKAMMYNLLNYSNSTVSQNKTPFLKTVLDEIHPDLFMVCELVNEAGSNYMFNNAIVPHNSDFEKATFQINQSSGANLQQMVYYNSKKLVLETSRVIVADTRDINHYTFKINTENVATNPIRLEVFVSHLKASTGSSNRQRRLASVEDFVVSLNDIPETSYVLFAGDFNFYSSNEEGYQRLIDGGNRVVMIDPINRPATPFPNNPSVTDPFTFYSSSSTYFWRNSSYADIHTQSTRTSNTGLIDTSGALGGLDDRFDFIMMSENFNTSSDLFYVNNSYQSIGNNSNCYNLSIDNSNCSGTYSQSLRDALLQVSDHLPVVMEIETPQNTLSTESYSQIVQFQNSNIVENSLDLKFSNNLKIKDLNIYNTNGQLIKSVKLKNVPENTLTIDVQHLSKGIYYLSAQNLNKPIKFVKI
ncbi:T9SS type A sorting domain-containing protein [Pseudotenacibaculum sp. MALMAid0570]|uniref:T9SS type A sorting domain-containing protein n=1 Tax=Pseudotenacibaculum sp. MALMAid0570 TaxID=3143938 RepID=UPI0032DF4D67